MTLFAITSEQLLCGPLHFGPRAAIPEYCYLSSVDVWYKFQGNISAS